MAVTALKGPLRGYRVSTTAASSCQEHGCDDKKQLRSMPAGRLYHADVTSAAAAELHYDDAVASKQGHLASGNTKHGSSY
jgi:hypothetical protein